MPRPHLIAIAGGSGSGKTTLARRVAVALGRPGGAVPVVPLDAYYRDDPRETAAERAARNFDAPEALDDALLVAHVARLRRGGAVERPTYDFATHRRTAATVLVRPAPHIVVEGLLALHWPALRALSDTRVFVRIAESLALARRTARDTAARGRTAASVRRQWSLTVQPMYRLHVEPTRRFADLTLDGAAPLERSVEALLALVRGRRP